MTCRQQLAQGDDGPTGTRVSLAAMIDMVFLLLIFFLFGSFDFAEQQVIAVLTRDSAAATVAEPPIWLRVRQSSGSLEYAVDDQPFARPDRATDVLAARCRESVNPTVVVEVAAGVKLQQLMDTFALARQAGAAEVALRAEGDRL
ncbi:MAG: hypothetical protein GY778_24970 [bacterium]|nr:hypothetical protein [bacterium]